MLKIEHLSKAYRKHQALNDCSFEAKAHEIHGILGQNGCGKSTLFKSIMGLIDPDQGEIHFKGSKVTFKDRKRFGYMPEQRSLFMDLTVLEQALFLGELKGMNKDLIHSRLDHLTKVLKFDKAVSTKIIHLSKGQQQKLQLILAFLHDPDVLILDEPLNGLDYFSVQLFMQVLRQWASEGKLILISSHQMDFMDELCTHVLVLNKGNIIHQGELKVLAQQEAVCISINADSNWQGLSQNHVQVEDKGSNVEFRYHNLDEAKKMIIKMSKERSITRLNLHHPSMSEYLEIEPCEHS
jgi:ABC-2 type transport system ATP-binding protein